MSCGRRALPQRSSLVWREIARDRRPLAHPSSGSRHHGQSARVENRDCRPRVKRLHPSRAGTCSLFASVHVPGGAVRRSSSQESSPSCLKDRLFTFPVGEPLADASNQELEHLDHASLTAGKALPVATSRLRLPRGSPGRSLWGPALSAAVRAAHDYDVDIDVSPRSSAEEHPRFNGRSLQPCLSLHRDHSAPRAPVTNSMATWRSSGLR